MSTHGTEFRKLAAIMFTDMVGFSALSQRNETLALELLDDQRRVLRVVLPKHQGVEIKTMGDGFLIEFASALAAVRCAIEIQDSIARHNAATPGGKTFQIRIGIHVGDVVKRDGDVHGDGVNIAARIEPLAPPGGICISEDVARQVQNKIPETFVKFGPAELKNIQLPVVVYKLSSGAVNAPATASSIPPTQGRPRFTPAVAVILLLLLVLVFWQIGKFPSSQPDPSPAATKPAQATKPALNPLRIAVLPLKNIGPDEKDEYFAEGMTEEMISSVSKIRGLTVIARTSVMNYKSSDKGVAEIGRELSVGTVLEGSVRKDGDQLRITVQLIDVASQGHLLATNYDRDFKEVFKIQSDVAARVAEVLKVKLLGVELQQLKKQPTANMEAFKLYQMGRYWWNKRTKPGLEKAIEHFEQALKLDLQYAVAHAGLAACYVIQPQVAAVPARRSIPKAQAAAEKALALDPSLGEAHAVLALAKDQLYDWSGAEAEYREAIRLSPNFPTVHQWFGIHFNTLGRFDDAKVEIRRAEELDPLSPIIKANIGVNFALTGQMDEAIQELRKGIEFDPNFAVFHLFLGAVYLKKHLHTEALGEFRKGIALNPEGNFGLGMFGNALALSGNRAEALEVLKQLDKLAAQDLAVDTARAAVYYGLGDIDKTFELLERAWAAGEDVSRTRSYLLWEDLRPDPRYQALLRKMNLAK